MEIRRLTTVPEFDACLDLQRQGFGWADVDLMPVRMFVVANHTGGLVLGAYENGKLIAFLSTLPGIKNGMGYWHSHMLAVVPEHRNSGVGAQLKFAQRDHAVQQGIRLIQWTFDPLESKNAYLNLVKLGAIVRSYYVNLYGETSGVLQRGLASDRVIAEWWVDQPRLAVTGEVRRIRIPADLQSMKKNDMEGARALQERVRQEFLKHIQDDFFAVAFERSGESSDYVLIRGASSAYKAG